MTDPLLQKIEKKMLLDNTRKTDRILTLRCQHFLRRRIQFNNLQSATRNLPHELLALIFLYDSPPIDIMPPSIRLGLEETHPDDRVREIYGPIRLGAVCSQWFYVAQSTPQLWSSLILNVQTRERVASKISILQAYLKNSQNVPFCLALDFNKENLPTTSVDHVPTSHSTTYDPEGFALLQPFYTIIFTCPENTRRIRVLRVNELPPAWSRFSFDDFPLLEELYVGASNVIRSKLKIKDLTTPRLNRIIMKNRSFLLNTASYQDRALTVVNLIGVRSADCLRILKLFPNLVDLRSRGHSDKFVGLENDIENTKITMPRLEIFEWGLENDAWTKEMLQHVRLPVLRALCFRPRRSVFPRNLLEGFFVGLPQSLVELGIVNRNIGLQAYWRLLTNVRKISLWRCQPACITYILESLANVHLLPSLQEISLIEPQYDRYIKTTATKQILNMIESRYRVLEGNRLTFRMIAHPLHWTSKDKNRYKQILKSGFELKVYENGHLLNWS